MTDDLPETDEEQPTHTLAEPEWVRCRTCDLWVYRHLTRRRRWWHLARTCRAYCLIQHNEPLNGSTTPEAGPE